MLAEYRMTLPPQSPETAEGTVDQPAPRSTRITDRIATVVPEDTLEISLRGFVDAATKAQRR